MASKEKRVLVILVEGTSDKVSLQSILENYFDTKKVQISVIHYDITQESIPADIKVKLNEKVQEFCSIEKIKVSDISKIIQIVDTDGVFVSENVVLQNQNNSKTSYTENEINANNRESILDRNKNKRTILNALSKLPELTVTTGNTNFKIPYSIYYFSRNLEHVLHSKIENLTDQEKEDLSNAFDDDYSGDSERFKVLISDDAFAVPGNYEETWEFIKQGNNSLKRYSNIHLLFED